MQPLEIVIQQKEITSLSTLMPNRFVHLLFHIDTNRINSKQMLENMNLLEEWHNNGVINIDMPEPATKESFAGNNTQRINKAALYLHSYTYCETPEEKERLRKIENILFPNGAKDQNQKNDVEIVFNAGKYCRILITDDGGSKKQPGGILGNAGKLKELGITVVSDAEAVNLVRKRIKDRDEMAKFLAKKEGLNVPEWVGKD